MPRPPDSSPQTRRLLDALLAEPQRWRHGYDLSKQTKLASGTLYPILMRLADRGLLETRWEPPSGPGRPPRHAYRLTADGVAFAHERCAQAQRPTAQRAGGRRPVTGRPAPTDALGSTA